MYVAKRLSVERNICNHCSCNCKGCDCVTRGGCLSCKCMKSKYSSTCGKEFLGTDGGWYRCDYVDNARLGYHEHINSKRGVTKSKSVSGICLIQRENEGD